MTSILQTIREKRSDQLRLRVLEPEHIKNFIVCICPEKDTAATKFCGALQELFSAGHTVRFSQPYSCCFLDAAKDAEKTANEERSNYVNGTAWSTACIAVMSDLEAAVDAASVAAEQHAGRLFVVYIGKTRPENRNFSEFFVWVPSAIAINKEVSVDTARAFAVWMLNLVQGKNLLPRLDDAEVPRNCLNGYIYDCIEQRMRCETAENIAGLLCDSPAERERFLKRVYNCVDQWKTDGLADRAVLTAGYEKLVRCLREELPANIFQWLLCKLSKSYRKAHCMWKCDAISCKYALDCLYGDGYLNEVAGREASVSTEAFDLCWRKNERPILQTTLKVLTEAERINGILDNELQRIFSERDDVLRVLETEKEKNYNPKGPQLKQLQAGLHTLDQQIQKLAKLECDASWIKYVKSKISKVVKDAKLEEKQQRYEHWKTQLGNASCEGQANYNWNKDPVPSVPAAYLTDEEDDRFDVDAGMQWLYDKLGGRTGQKLLCANIRYSKENWGSPSVRNNGINNVMDDRFTYSEGVSESELVLLCMDTY